MPTTAQTANRALAYLRSTSWVGRFFERPVGRRVQHLVGRTWQRIQERFPALLGEGPPREGRQRQTVGVARWEVSERAEQGIGVNAPSVPPEELMATLRDSQEWAERATAANALASLDGENVTDALIAALRDPSAEVASAAVTALAAARGEGRISDVLREVIMNRDGYFAGLTRAAAVTVSASRRDEADLKPVLDAVNDLDAEVSLSAIAAIADCAPHAVIASVLPVLQDRSGYFLPIVRLAAAQAMLRAGALFGALRADLLAEERDTKVRAVLEEAAAR